MTPVRTWRQQAIRFALLGIILLSPMFGGILSVSLFAVAAGIVLAYEGLDEEAVMWLAGLFFITEIVWGIGLGVVSFSFVVTVLILRILEKFVAVTPLARESDWDGVSLARTALLAVVLTVLMTSWSVVVQAIVYRQGTIGRLVSGAFHPFVGTLIVLACVASAGIVILHRIDVPFRRKIIFGK